jgi:uncharacterized Zn finger protein
MARWSNYDDYPIYVSAAERKLKAQAKIKKLISKGEKLSPVVIEGHKIVNTFWGKAWCDNIESYHDFENRLPRGRSYVRQGAVIDLQIAKGRITAKVQGSELYEININITELPNDKWQKIKKSCSGKIDSLINLIQGKLSQETIALLCRKDDGIFPSPKEIKLICNCPDYADLCKHLAAVLYGVGARLDSQPELFFLLRGVDQNELLSADFANDIVDTDAAATIITADLGGIFGIELDTFDAPNTHMPKAKVAATTKKAAIHTLASSKNVAAPTPKVASKTAKKTAITPSTKVAAKTPKVKPTLSPAKKNQLIAPQKSIKIIAAETPRKHGRRARRVGKNKI